MTTFLFATIEMKIYFLVDINEDPKTKYMQQETVLNVHAVQSVTRCDTTESSCNLVEAQFYISFHAITGACHAASFTSISALAPFWPVGIIIKPNIMDCCWLISLSTD